jgi:UDP-2,4-diacetamido-2,4,6-trideoxy-beta-L-altropyranose hydrolase
VTGRPSVLLLRADADPILGAGHVVRSLALAQAWRDRGGVAAFVGRCANPWLCNLLRREGLEVHPLEASYPDARDLEGTLAAAAHLDASGPAWVAVDGYRFDGPYHRALRQSGLRVVVVDDLAHLPAYDVDLVVNPNPSSEELTYRLNSETLLFAGPQAALLRREFRAARATHVPTPARANRFLVLTGGGDAARTGPRLLDAIRAAGWGDGEGRFVVGPLDTSEDVSGAVEALGPGWRVVRGADDMPALMSWADLALTAGGGAVLELASVGTPAVAVATASNQAANTRSLAHIGALQLLGPGGDLSPERAAPLLRRIRDDAEARGRMSSLGYQMVDGSGAERVARAMAVLAGPRGEGDFGLRAAAFDDAFLLWRWASDPVVRQNSFSQDPIPWETHLEWLSRKLASPDTRLWLLEYCSVPAATIRYDRVDADTARIGFSVAASFRGRGLGTKVLRISAFRAGRELGVKVLEGKVRPGNEASARAFLSAGFLEAAVGDDAPSARVFRRMVAETGDRDGN